MIPALMQRRTFLAATVGMLSAAASGRGRPITLGFSLYGMAALPVPEAIAAAARIGYDDVEMASLAGYPGDPDRLDSAARVQIRKILETHRLQISAFMDNLKLLAEDFANRMGQPNFVRVVVHRQTFRIKRPELAAATLVNTETIFARRWQRAELRGLGHCGPVSRWKRGSS
jgi:sugar phosphate isomerase/epimerase